MARYGVNQAAVDHTRRLIETRRYVLDSDWGDVQPGLRSRTPTSSGTGGTGTRNGTSGSPRARPTRRRPATRSWSATSAGCTEQR